jgi:uncharacterized membrane protein YphA (DoxX/SURF4 family)
MRYPQTGIALLRIVVGSWFLKAVWTKLTVVYVGGVVPVPAVSPRFLAFQPKRVAEFAADNPVAWYKEFLQETVLPHAKLFATLQACGEVVVGIGLVLGLFTGLAALIGFVLSVNYGLATQWMSFGQQGFHVLLITSMVIFLMTGAGRQWGLDQVLPSRMKEWRWVRAFV